MSACNQSSKQQVPSRDSFFGCGGDEEEEEEEEGEDDAGEVEENSFNRLCVWYEFQNTSTQISAKSA